MKIELDLEDILIGEFGDKQSLAETIKDGIVENLTKTLQKGITDRITTEISNVIDAEIKLVVAEQMPSLLTELIDKEYRVVDKWGEHKETITIRNQLIKTLTDQMVYAPKNYNSDKNFFTRNVDVLVSESMDKFKKEYDSKVNEIFVKEALEYATNKLKKTLNLK